MHPALRRILLALLLSGCAAAQAASIQNFVPQGRIEQQNRATAVFSADMVSLGDTAAAAPFVVDCGAVKGEGRWQDARIWTWRLERPLQGGERCIFTLRSDLTAANGAKVSGNGRYEFYASAAPWPRRIEPAPGATIDEDQLFIIEASGQIDPTSAEKNLWCEAEGVGNRIAVRLTPEAQRREILAKLNRGFDQTPLLLSCAERLPPGTKMKLVWGKGIAATNGTLAEKEESFVYSVRKPFHGSMSCEREKAAAPCSPLAAVQLMFGTDVPLKQLKDIRLRVTDADGKPSPRTPKDPNLGNSLRRDSDNAVTFPGPFPQNAQLTLEIPAGLKDLSGRTLDNAASFPLKFKTGTLPPLAKFPGNFGIVELKEGALLPVTLRNVETRLATANLRLPGAHRYAAQRLTEDGDVIAAMHALARFEQQTRKVRLKRDGVEEEFVDPYYARELSFLGQRAGVTRQELPKPGGTAEFEVVGIPLGKPGYHVVEIESRMLGAALLAQPAPMYVRTAVLVTNMAVHLKRGRDNALVWVTALDSGKPVADAEVRVSTCNGRELWRGKTDARGRAMIAKPLPAESCLLATDRQLLHAGRRGTGETIEPYLFASARLGEDYSFVRSDWNEGIESWRFGIETWGERADFKIHSILDRTLLRPGQTLSMKHIARNRDSRGFTFPTPESLPNKLTIRHADSGTEFSQPLVWDAHGSAVSQWKIPDSAKRGNYEVALSGGARGMSVGAEFRVGDFRLPVYTGSIQGVPPRQVAPKSVPLALSLSFLNGGAAKGAEVKVAATLRPRWPTYPHFERFNFNIDFNEADLQAFDIERNREHEHLIVDNQPLTLDRAGAGRFDVALPDRPKGPSEVYAEMTFNDPNGEIQTIHGSVELWPAAVVLGISVRDWASTRGGENSVEFVTLDTHGRPVGGQDIRVHAKRRIDYSHRRRVVGGFYTYENSHEYVDLGEVCRGTTDSRGLFTCAPQTSDPGSVLLLAETRDAQGNVARASSSYWVSGNGDLWFTAGNQDRIDVIPERRSYKPGETARLQVRTPFREATALISVEAGGIIETHVQPLSRFNPLIELPVKAEWGPNVYVSVLAVRGRVEPLRWYSFFEWGWREPLTWFRDWWNPQQPTAMVDLAKPAYRLGLAEIGVGTEGFRLNVDVQPEKRDYRPRDEAVVRLKVTTPDGKPAPAGSEIAFAAVDQALLELKPNDTWNLLDGLLQKRSYEVETATAQSQVIGKRHFGRKALPPGGGGGRGPARELFDTLLLWNPRVMLDASGMATLKVPINDSLTEFKLVGVATAGTALFGTGSATLRTRQDLQLISGLPPLVREKDSFQALLTVRNGTARPMNVSVSAKVGDKTLESRQIKLDAEGAGELRWTSQAPEGVSQLNWEFAAREEGGSAAQDRLKIAQQIAPAVPVTVQQASFTRIDGKYEVSAVLPAGALPGKGGIEIGLSPRLSTPPPGLRRFFQDYPFGCLEQKTSIAVGLHDAKRWQEIVATLPAYLDDNGLARYFPGEGPGSPTLTAYLLDMSSLAGLALPDDVRSRMLHGLTAFAEGRFRARLWAPAGIDGLLMHKLNALEAITRQGPALNATATRIAAAFDVSLQRLPTAALLDWYLVVRRLPELPQRSTRLAEATQELKNRLSYTGGRLGFTTEKSDYWWWMMVSGDSNAFRLIEAMLDEPAWQEDLPRLLRGAVERQAHGRWFTTTANAWASVVLDRFGRKFERDAVTGTTRASLGGASAELRWPNGAYDVTAAAPLMLPWPTAGKADKLAINHSGTGKPWANLQVLAAIPAGAPRAFGYSIKRTIRPLHGRDDDHNRPGDLWRVTLDIEADQDMTWVVVSDPIPGGARILGDGLGRDSRIATQDEDRIGRHLWPTYIERSFGAFRAYYEVVPKGRFRIDYTMRLNNVGTFSLPPTRVEAMYAPDVYGEIANEAVVVE